MRALLLITLLSPLALSACGGDEHKTVYVAPQPGETVVVPDDNDDDVEVYDYD